MKTLRFVLGDQLSRALSALRDLDPIRDVVLMVEAHEETTYVRHHRQKIALDAKLTAALGSITVAMEAYPDLKANENVMHLQRSLHEVEEQISAARRAYNQAVTDLNNAIEMFPTNLMAGWMKLGRRSVFEITVAERQNVNVHELFNR